VPRRWPRAALGVSACVAFGVAATACGGGATPNASGVHQSATLVDSTLTKAIHELNQGQTANAVADFLAVVKKDARNQIAWYDLGVIAQREGQSTRAAHDYESSIAGDATYVPALYNLAVLEAASNPRGAVALYQRVIALQPNDADAHLNLGFALQALGQPSAGALQLAKAVQLDPSLASRIPSTTGG
jgi:Tfp pilus assembly protein PilF